MSAPPETAATAKKPARARAPRKKLPSCSVVIPTIEGREHWLAQCVEAYERTMPGVEVIVVKGKPSCGEAWQEGAEKATGPYVHLTADDLVPIQGWFEAAKEAADQGAIPIAHVLTATDANGAWLEQSVMDTRSFLLGDRETLNVLVPFLTRAMFDDNEDGDSWILPIHYGSDDWVTFLADRRGIRTVAAPSYRFGHGAAEEGRLHQSRTVDIPILCDRMAAWGPVPTVYQQLGVANGWSGEAPSQTRFGGPSVNAGIARPPVGPNPFAGVIVDEPLVIGADYYWNGPQLPGQPKPPPPHPGVGRASQAPRFPRIATVGREGPRMVWSGSQFNNELDVLEIRLGTIGHMIDRFVLAEATVDQRGRPKPLVFPEHRERFAPWLDKIEYVIVDDMPVGDSREMSWVRERWQRDAILRGMTSLRGDDLVLISDLDEIPSPEALADAMGRPPVRFAMDLFVYRLNWRWLDRNEQIATLASVHVGEDFLRAGSINDVVLTGPWSLRPDSGWHLTYQGTVEQLRAKMTGMADAFFEDLVPEAAKVGISGPEDFLTDAWIEGSVNTGRDIYARDYRGTEWVDLDALPPYVAAHPDRFAHMLIPNPAANVEPEPEAAAA